MRLQAELLDLEARLAEVRGLQQMSKTMDSLSITPPPLLQNGSDVTKNEDTNGGGEQETEAEKEARFARQTQDLHVSLANKMRSLEKIYAAKKAELEQGPSSMPPSKDDRGIDLERLAQEVREVRQQWEMAQLRRLELEQKIRQLRERQDTEKFIFKGRLIVLEEMRNYLQVMLIFFECKSTLLVQHLIIAVSRSIIDDISTTFSR